MTARKTPERGEGTRSSDQLAQNGERAAAAQHQSPENTTQQDRAGSESERPSDSRSLERQVAELSEQIRQIKGDRLQERMVFLETHLAQLEARDQRR